MNTYKATTGTFTATVNGVANFNADLLYLTLHHTIEISGIQESENSPVRTILIGLLPDVQNGTYTFNVDPELTRLGAIASASGWYVTDSGTVTVNFDRDADHYRGQVEILAYELVSGDELRVKGDFDLHGITLVRRHRH
ncbi:MULTISPECIES: hypothetical protein [Pseudomonas]|uniref:hypothetical protein n=1 Tax=Pseudomonas TaxID=286 RepID=UPI0015A3D38C|nr:MULTISPECIES: hypothetical protein [Pseudomonas]NVZ25985.1 hypothetical protein [Pseudomonas gingeri]NVZ60976.1 hypothetical protein [Pseudomonas gingeri]NVZ78003.1 hypothetical protein [Pseudomonas gingeri]NWA07995.1 hypothetical protein [Pseudomonas gingeri]NWE44716.1 hypothetical protein [Pseudomonas gingeri]